jgi:hypothetical protein
MFFRSMTEKSVYCRNTQEIAPIYVKELTETQITFITV